MIADGMRLTILLKSEHQDTEQNMVNGRLSFPSIACFTISTFSYFFIVFGEFSSLRLAFVSWYFLQKHGEAPSLLLQEFNDEVININIFVLIYM